MIDPRKILAGLVVTIACASAAPALAVPYCTDNRPGVTFEFSIGDREFGGKSLEEQQNEQDRRRLRRIGVNAFDVESWNGCIRAFVRTPEGITMQYYDPNTLERLL